MTVNRTVSSFLLMGIALVCHAAFAKPAGGEVETEQTSAPVEEKTWSFHGQLTALPQYHGSFYSAYPGGKNSLPSTPEYKTSYTGTFFLGFRVPWWKGTELYFNPESTAGSGFADTHGMAAYPNGEIYRVDSADPKLYLSRIFLRQTFGLGGPQEFIESGANAVAHREDVSRITVTFGKFSLNDIFDNNTYSHDPRSQFMNWANMDIAAWDYAADTRGYTWAIVVEYNQPSWAIRLGSGLVATDANGLNLETDITKARGDNLEFEYRYSLGQRPGKARFLAYANQANMGLFSLANASSTTPPDIAQSRAYRTKYGFGLNLEQEVLPELGLFARLGWDDGQTESWMFTQADQSLAVGGSLKGTWWGREMDTCGLSLIVDGLSSGQSTYLSKGGVGFIIGDGALNYGLETVVEAYYSYRPIKWVSLTGDYQFVVNPAYNQDRGPVSIFSARLHAEL